MLNIYWYKSCSIYLCSKCKIKHFWENVTSKLWQASYSIRTIKKGNHLSYHEAEYWILYIFSIHSQIKKRSRKIISILLFELNHSRVTFLHHFFKFFLPPSLMAATSSISWKKQIWLPSRIYDSICFYSNVDINQQKMV